VTDGWRPGRGDPFVSNWRRESAGRLPGLQPREAVVLPSIPTTRQEDELDGRHRASPAWAVGADFVETTLVRAAEVAPEGQPGITEAPPATVGLRAVMAGHRPGPPAINTQGSRRDKQNGIPTETPQRQGNLAKRGRSRLPLGRTGEIDGRTNGRWDEKT